MCCVVVVVVVLILFLEALCDLGDRAALEVKDADVLAIMDQGEGPPPSDAVVPFVPSIPRSEAREQYSIAVSFARALLPTAMLPRYKVTTSAGVEHVVMIDGCSHSSGRKRVYAACPLKRAHPACFRYRFIDSFPNLETAVASVAAWRDRASGAGNDFTRMDHYRCQVDPAVVADLIPRISHV